MTWLRDPTCPNCDSAVDLTELWRAAPKASRSSAIRGAVGIACPHCGVRLRVQQHRLMGANVLGFLAMIGAAAVVTSRFPVLRAEIAKVPLFFALLVAYVSLGIWINAVAPRLLTLRRLRDDERVLYPLEAVPDEGPEPTQEDDDRAALAGVMNPPDSEPESGKTWRCPKCGEENPGNFEACWKCETERPGAATRGPEQS